MRKKKYQSHEMKSQNIWLNVWEAEDSYQTGTIEVKGDTASGYRILRRGRLVGKELSLGLSNIIFGDAGVCFDKRKDAENFALVLAMHFSGDLMTEGLLDPTIFNGFQSQQISLSKARTDLFWAGASKVDPSTGWEEVDPERLLEKIPDTSEPLPHYDEDENGEDELDMRSYHISEAAEAVVQYYKEWFLTAKVEIPLHEVVANVLLEKLVDNCEISTEDRGYVTLLALAKLCGGIPVKWVFPVNQDDVMRLIPRLWASLSEDVKVYITKCEAVDSQARKQAAMVQRVKQNILSQLPATVNEANREVQTRINSCASHFVEVLEGKHELPTHSEPDYRVLMQNFANKAMVD